MSKRQVLILVLAAVALTACSVALSRRDSRDWRANRSRRLFPFPWQDAVSVEITRPNAPGLRFEKSPDGEWLLRLSPELADSLDHRAVDHLSALATLTWREPRAEARPPAPGAGATLTAVSSAGQSVSLAFGEVRNNLRATVVDGDDSVVYGVNQDLLDFLDWPESRFRNLYLAAGGGGRKPVRVALSPAGGDPALGIVLERDDAGWRQTAPVAWPVDEARLDLLLRWLERLRADGIAAELTGDLEWFGFTPDAARVEVAYRLDAGERRRAVEFGGEAGKGERYARATDRNPVFILPEEALAEISLDVAAEHRNLWRNFYRLRSLNTVGDVMPEAIVVERLLPAPEKLTLEQVRRPDGVRWRGVLESGGKTTEFPVDPPDAAEPMRPLTALITGLSSLRVKTFLAETPPGPETVRWTAYPAWRFSCRLADGGASPALTLYAADARGNPPPGAPFAEGTAGPRDLPAPEAGVAFSLADRQAIMEMHAELSYLLCLPPYRYRSRRLLDEDPRRWTRVEISRGDATDVYFRREGEVNEQWWLDSTPPEPLLDDNNRFVALLGVLSQLRSEGFVDESGDDAAKFGLDQPEITAIVYTSKTKAAPGSRDGLLFRLAVGGPDADGKRYARLGDEGPVFLVSVGLSEGLERPYR